MGSSIVHEKARKTEPFSCRCGDSLRSHVTARLRDQKIKKKTWTREKLHGWRGGKMEKFPNSVITQN